MTTFLHLTPQNYLKLIVSNGFTRLAIQLLIISLLTFVLCACGATNDVIYREGRPDVFDVVHEDKEMNAAIEEAQRTIDTFITDFESPKPSQTYFSVKAKFLYDTVNDTSEHMWLIDISYQDGKFTGKIGNEPVYRKDLKLGDEVTVPISSITDWMIIEDGKLIGGYTIRVLRNRMSETEREAFDKDLDFIIEN